MRLRHNHVTRMLTDQESLQWKEAHSFEITGPQTQQIGAAAGIPMSEDRIAAKDENNGTDNSRKG